jgi:Tol biopolymer transport system component
MDPSPPPSGAVQEQLERMLASDTFRGAERSRALLSFIVSEALQGRADRLKDYTLGSQALGRGDQFDPRTDPVARVEASRLRSRLDMYYATEGASDPVRISLPKGGYVPAFQSQPLRLAVSSSDPVSTGLPTQFVVPLAAAVALVSIVGVWLLTRTTPTARVAPETRVEMIALPTTDPVSLAVSPDGRSIVFVGSAEGRSRLWIRRLDSDTPRELVGTDYPSLPFWSPDGRSIGFFADSRIKSIDIETAQVRVVSTALVPAGATWNEDGVILHPLVPDGPLFRRSAADPALVPATQLAPGQTGHRSPTFLPDGRRFLFYAAGIPDAKGIYVGELGTTAIRRVLDADASPVFAPPDHLLYIQHSGLFAHRIDVETLTLLGDPIPLAEGIPADTVRGVAALSAGSDTLAYRKGSAAIKRQFVWFDRKGKELSRVGSAIPMGPSYASLSPDGRRLAVQRSLEGNTDILLLDAERGTGIRFTTEPQADIAPLWSPRGDRIVYATQKGGTFQLVEKPLDGSPARDLLDTPQAKQITDWSRDGRYLLFRTITATPDVDMDIWAVPFEGDRTPFPVVRTPFEERDAQFSPDGKWIAYHSNESGRHEIYVRPFPGPGGPERISADGGVQARWRADGRELFYLTLDGKLVAIPLALRPDGRSHKPGPAVSLFQARVGPVQGVALHSYIAAPDGDRFLFETVIEETPSPISLILNWKPQPR